VPVVKSMKEKEEEEEEEASQVYKVDWIEKWQDISCLLGFWLLGTNMCDSLLIML